MEDIRNQGTELCAAVDALRTAMASQTIAATMSIPAEVLDLERHAREVRSPEEAALWHATALQYRDDLAQRLRREANILRRSQAPDHDKILELLQRGIATAPSETLLDSIQADLRQAEVDARRAVSPTFTGFRPVGFRPRLFFFRGAGFAMGGLTPIENDPDYYYSTQYLIFLCLPLLPIGRYVVRNDSVTDRIKPFRNGTIGTVFTVTDFRQRKDHNWSFYYRAPWTMSMRVRFALATVLLYWLFSRGR